MAHDDQLEVDREYLWALEVIACNELDDREDQQPGKVEEARRVVDNASLTQPRHPTQPAGGSCPECGSSNLGEPPGGYDYQCLDCHERFDSQYAKPP